MDNSEIFKIIDFTIKGDRWKYYQKTCDYAKKLLRYNTGEDMDLELVQYQPRESLDAMAQRKLLTKEIVSAICSSIRQPFYQVPRSPGIHRSYDFKKEDSLPQNKDNAKIFKDKITNFFGNESLSYYLDQRLSELPFFDPNAYILIEWKEFDATKEKASPYPFEANSFNVVNKSTFNGVLDWLIVYQGDEDFKKPESWTYYCKNETIKYQRETNENIITKFNSGIDYQKIEIDGILYVKINNVVYAVNVPVPHNLGYVQAFSMGYRSKLDCYGKMFESPLQPGMPYLEKVTKITSELDLTTFLHVYPQKFQYVRKCMASDCNGGDLVAGGKCPKCGGLGYEVHKTAQDVILLPMPDSKDEMLTLSELVHYAYPPTDIVSKQVELLNANAEGAVRAVFNSDITVRPSVTDTATGKLIDLQSLYNTLYPFGLFSKNAWMFMMKAVADITDLSNGLELTYVVSKDFKLKSYDDLVLELKNATENNLPSVIRQQIMNDIAESILSDRPYDIARFRTKQIFEPWLWKSQEELMMILAELPLTHPKKILRMFYDEIFTELEKEVFDPTNFYYLPYEIQKEFIDKKIKEYSEFLPAQEQPTIDFTKYGVEEE